MPDLDAIIIGSGAGGMTAALAMARAGQKVLVLEQHYLPGGWTHSFPLGGHLFSPGVHYMGALGPGGRMREIYEHLGVAGELVFCELNPDGYDHVQVGDQRYHLLKGRDRTAATLGERFPRDAVGISAFLQAMSEIDAGTRALSAAPGGLSKARAVASHPALALWGLGSLERVLRHHVRDPVARAVLAAQCGDHGLPPSRTPAALQAGLMSHYFDGAWYPMGGARSIPRAFIHALRREGGTIRVRSPVSRILTERGPDGPRAVGVRLRSGEEISARVVVSNADPGVTYGRLLPEELLSAGLRKRLASTRWSVSCLSLFMAAEIDAGAHGLDSGNLWIFRDPDVERAFGPGAGVPLDQLEEFPAIFLTVTTLKDRTKLKGGVHTLEAFALLPYAAFSGWSDTEAEHRPGSYARVKAHLQEKMLDAVARVIPDIRERLVMAELGTPLTNVHFCAATGGGMYGTEKTLGNIGPFAFPTRTEIQGLYACGASGASHGVMGATESGLSAAAAALGVRKRELLRHQGPPLRTVLADRPDLWPEDLRRKIGQNHED